MAGWPSWHEVQRSAALTETVDTKVLEDVDASSANTGLSKASTAATVTEDIAAAVGSSHSSDWQHAGDQATVHARELWRSWQKGGCQAPDWGRPRMPSCLLPLHGRPVLPPSVQPPAIPNVLSNAFSLAHWQRPAPATAIQTGYSRMRAGKFGNPTACRSERQADPSSEVRGATAARPPRHLEAPASGTAGDRAVRDLPRGPVQPSIVDLMTAEASAAATPAPAGRALDPPRQRQEPSYSSATVSSSAPGLASYAVLQMMQLCPNGHCLERSTPAWSAGSCDLCGKPVEQGEMLQVCQVCDPEWWRCRTCGSHGRCDSPLPNAPPSTASSALVPSLLPTQASQLQLVPIGHAMAMAKYSCTGGCRRSWNTWEEVPYWSKNRPRKPWCDECGKEVPGPWNEWIPPPC